MPLAIPSLVKTLYASQKTTVQSPSKDELIRLVMQPWVHTVIINGTSVSVPSMQGVERKQIRTSVAAQREFMLRNGKRSITFAEFDALRQTITQSLDEMKQTLESRVAPLAPAMLSAAPPAAPSGSADTAQGSNYTELGEAASTALRALDAAIPVLERELHADKKKKGS